MKQEIHVFDEAIHAAQAIAELILKKSLIKLQQDHFINIALSGGSTPKLLFDLLAKDEYRISIPWHIVRVFWVDERCVPPTDAESNYGMTYETLIKHIEIPPENVFRMKGENELSKEAVRYSNLLHQELSEKNGFPVFDLILLGIGDDGHMASIFPDNLSLLESKKTVETAIHPISGQKRITLTGKTINNAEQLIFFVTGKGKSAIMKDLTEKNSKAFQYPAYYVHNQAGIVEFYLDTDAASQI